MSIVFSEEEWNWNTHSLYDFVYTYMNMPYFYKDFFYTQEVQNILKDISNNLTERAKVKTIYPPLHKVFRAFRIANPLVVILGMDPYHSPEGAAVGLCFSIPKHFTEINPSLRSIQKEVKNNGFDVNNKNGDISSWADQGVLMLNSALTVEKGDAGSHLELWSHFTELFIKYISEKFALAWLLWGKDAQSYEENITNKVKHFICKTSHPMPLAASKPSGGNPPFLESQCFIKVNQWLKQRGNREIDWKIE